MESPAAEVITYDHKHIMGHAIQTASSLGFMLYDLNNEFCSRFVSELLLCDKNAKAIGSPHIITRYKLGAFIGEGNAHFFKYSMLGHVYLFLLIIMEEAIKETSENPAPDKAIEGILSRRIIYERLNLRSWRLPKQWGTGKACINMAESIGFIIGAYTVPPDIPVLYITDSNNARTLQRNVKNNKGFTHRKMVRCVKQGIDQSIANHLEYLTSQWLSEDQIDENMNRLYAKGEEACKQWVLHTIPIRETYNDNTDQRTQSTAKLKNKKAR